MKMRCISRESPWKTPTLARKDRLLIFWVWRTFDVAADEKRESVSMSDGATVPPVHPKKDYRISKGRGGFGDMKAFQIDPSAIFIAMAPIDVCSPNNGVFT